MKKRLLTVAAFVLFAFTGLSQAPEGFTYQAVIRDASNTILLNQNVGIKLTVRQGTANGAAVYSETFAVTTNNVGIINLEIGTGTTVDNFSSIDWGNGPYFMETAVDNAGGTAYVVMGSSKLMSVPYALYAKNSGSAIPGPQGPAGPAGAPGLQGTDGADGVGIVSTVDNGDGTFTWNYSDGSSFTTSNLTGPEGSAGATGPTGPQGPAGTNGTNGTDGVNGVGIVSTIDNGDGTFTLNYSDGSFFTTANFTGPQGPTGAIGATGPEGPQGPAGTNGTNGTDRVGIVSTVDNGNGTFTLNYSDGSTFTTADLTGPTGATGAMGATGPQGTTGATGPQGPAGTNGTNGTDGVGIVSTVDNGNGTFTLNYSDGSSFTTADLTGPTGATGATGPQGTTGVTGAQGPAGINGTDGVGIVSTVDNGDGTFTLNYSDATSFTTSDLTGPTGATGPQGPAGVGIAQTLSLAGANLTLSDGGGTVSINDADANPTNELQTFSNGPAGTYTYILSDGGGSIDVKDADSDAMNELQTISLSAPNMITLSNGGGSISNDDADANPTNEIQTLSKVGTTVSLSNGGGSVSIADNDDNSANELQTISRVGTTVTLSAGGGSVSIADNDNDSANELQTLNLSGQDISISAGNTITIPTQTLIQDADTDTKVLVEFSPDEDIIHFNVAGTERWKMTGDRIEPNGTNVKIGYAAGESTSGSRNVYIGDATAQIGGSGSDNVAIGSMALFNSSSAKWNVALGTSALENQFDGGGNIAIGMYTLQNNLQGDLITAVGHQAMRYYNANVLGNAYNTALGAYSLMGSTTVSLNTGKYNTAIGYEALKQNTSGSNNTSLGYRSLYTTTSGTYQVGIGYNAQVLASSTNSIAIGYNAYSNASNKTVIGDVSMAVIGGYQNWSNLSDGRFKSNIQENVSGLEFINKLRPVTYNLNVAKLNEFLGVDNKDNPEMQKSMEAKERLVQSGFIAQEVEAAAKELGYDFSGVATPQNENDHYSLRYSEFVVPLVKSVQELNTMVESNQELIKKQQELIEQLQRKIEALENKE